LFLTQIEIVLGTVFGGQVVIGLDSLLPSRGTCSGYESG